MSPLAGVKGRLVGRMDRARVRRPAGPIFNVERGRRMVESVIEQQRRTMAAVGRVVADFERRMAPVRAVEMALAEDVARYLASQVR
jgi:hypothetical protein